MVIFQLNYDKKNHRREKYELMTFNREALFGGKS